MPSLREVNTCLASGGRTSPVDLFPRTPGGLTPPARQGMTLAELLVVMAVLVSLAALLVPMYGRSLQTSELDITFQTMTALRNAVVGNGGPSYLQDMKGLSPGVSDPDALAGIPFTINDLLSPAGKPTFDPAFRRGWRGPYLAQTSGSTTVLDSFNYLDSATKLQKQGRPIVLQWPPVGTPNRPYRVRLVSLGIDGALDAGYQNTWDPAILAGSPSLSKDDVILYLRADPTAGGNPWTNYYDLKAKQQAQ